ncbi:MAG: hypothetical protein NVS9B14_06710 [Candidatus Acidiferrum sp.]
MLNDANVGANAPIAIALIQRAAGVVTVNTVGAHGLIAGATPDQATIAGVSIGVNSFNGTFSVASVINATQFTYVQAGANESSNNGTVSNVGQGAVWTDAVLMPYLNIAYRKVADALENVGAPSPVRDDVLLTIPAIAGPDASLQVSLTDSTTPQLPVDLEAPLKLWERPAGSSQNFFEMVDVTNKGGLPSRFQDQILSVWEWRTDGIYFLGATQDTQIRMRYRAIYADLVDGTSNVLIRKSTNAIAFGAAAVAGGSRGSPLAEKWDAASQDALEDLIARAARQNQRAGTRRRPFSSRSGFSPF